MLARRLHGGTSCYVPPLTERSRSNLRSLADKQACRLASLDYHASACIPLRIDYIQHFVLIPYRRQAADFIHGFAVILRAECDVHFVHAPFFAKRLISARRRAIIRKTTLSKGLAMYQITVPIQNRLVNESTKEEYLRLLKEAEAACVLLIAEDNICYSRFAENVAFFKKEGFSVGVWLAETIGHGGVLLNGLDGEKKHFSPLVDINGETALGTNCPLDPAFRAEMANVAASLAKTGVSFILLDDDLRMSQHGKDFSCACDAHLALMSEYLGKAVTREEVRTHAFSGMPNEYRDAWLYAQSRSMTLLAQEMRDAVDAVAPSVTIAFCAAHSPFSVDGIDTVALTKLLAGENAPFIRLHGAPYWVTFNKWSFSEIFSYSRMFGAFFKDSGIEGWAEGDVYPRPCYNAPASHLELFDAMVRIDGTHGGILKYMADYTAPPLFETGYFARHVRNKARAAKLAETFPQGANLGVRAKLVPHLFKDADLSLSPACAASPKPTSAAWLGRNAIPVVFSGKGLATAAFGENARHLTEEELSGGLILDGVAAVILSQMGVDVGISFPYDFAVRKYRYLATEKTDEMGAVMNGDARVLTAPLKDGATPVLFGYEEGTPEVFAYTYENANGARFLVYLADGESVAGGSGLFGNYMQSIMLSRTIPWVARTSLPISAPHIPELYVMCEREEKKTAIALLNCHADSIMTPTFTLDRAYKAASCDGGKCYLDGDKLVFTTDISAYDYVTVVLTEEEK